MNIIKVKGNIFLWLALGIFAALATSALLVSVATRKEAQKHQLPVLAELSEQNVRPTVWGKGFPDQLADHLAMQENAPHTLYGGGQPYSKLIRFPQLTALWAGYPFAVDFNEERSHYYSQYDQVHIKRNNREYLNAHGFPKFKGQPGACMNCHSGWAPSLIKEIGWEKFNAMPYKDLRNGLEEKHGPGMHNADLGGTCADCHSPKDMALRVTRPAYVNAMVQRGYTADPEKGIVATPQEMRSHVCQQCHVEYYFKGENKELVFPWSKWPKSQPLKIEMIEDHYQTMRQAKVFTSDWEHKTTGAPMLKAQHPETELASSGIHARSGVSCADCHMPYVRRGARKVSLHRISSPLHHIQESCGTCHMRSEDELRERVFFIQKKTGCGRLQAEQAILALIQDIERAKALLQEKGLGEKIDLALTDAREAHRVASFRWDFIASENSMGFHSSQESSRVLGLAATKAREGQLLLIARLAELGVSFQPNPASGQIPLPPAPIGDDPVVGASPASVGVPGLAECSAE